MKKNLFPTLWVMIVALVMSSCAKTAYKKVIPANASVVVELDIKSVAQKADLLGQKDAIAKLVKSLDDSEETQGIANLIQNPMDAGFDLLSPGYFFVNGENIEEVYLLFSVKNKDKIWSLIKEKNMLQIEEDGDYAWLKAEEQVVGVVTPNLFLTSSTGEKSALRKLLEQDKANSFFATEAGKMMADNSGDVTLMLNLASLDKDLKEQAVRELMREGGRNVPGFENIAKSLMETQTVLNLVFEKGNISLNAITNGVQEQADQLFSSKISPATLEKIPAAGLVGFVAMSLDGKAYWEALLPTLEPMIAPMGDEGEKILGIIGGYVQAMDGTLAVSLSGEDKYARDPEVLALMPAPKTDFDKALDAIGEPLPEIIKVGGDDQYTSVTNMPSYTYNSVSAGFDKAKNAKASYFYAYVDAAPVCKSLRPEVEEELDGAPAGMLNVADNLRALPKFAELKVEEKNTASLTLWLNDDSKNALAILLENAIRFYQAVN